MTHGAHITRSQERAVTAFEVEVETMWVKLTKLRRGKTAEVWLTQNWLLTQRSYPQSQQVGVYDAGVSLAALREDCFWMLGQAVKESKR